METEKKGIDKKKQNKIVAFSLLGLLIFGFVVFAIVDLNSDNEPNAEIEVPEGEENKIDSKSKGIGTDTIDRSNEVDLNRIYEDEPQDNKRKEDEDMKALQASIDKSIRDAEETKKNERLSNASNSRVSRNRNYNNNYNEREDDNNVPVVKPIAKVIPAKEVVEENSVVENKKAKTSGFFKKKKNTSSTVKEADINIFASVHTNQVIMNNQRVKFRTTKEFVYNGQIYPINTIVYGLAQIKPNRLLIKVNKINQTDIKLEVYDSEDSEQGLYVLTPNLNASLQKELKKEGINEDDLGKIPFSRSLKNIFEKKVKEEKVQLINNYKVIIKIAQDE
jgi:hypothetical protein